MWPNPQFPVDLVTFTEEILTGKLHFFCSDKLCWLRKKNTDFIKKIRCGHVMSQLFSNLRYIDDIFFTCTHQKAEVKKIMKELLLNLNLLSANPTKWSNTLRQLGGMPTNCLSVFDHFLGLVLKGLYLDISRREKDLDF